jgi:hypothetical protein
MAASAIVLQRRFRLSQVLGVVGVLVGVLLSLTPTIANASLGGHNVFLNSLVFGCSSLFLAFAIVFKEIALNGKPRRHKLAASITQNSVQLAAADGVSRRETSPLSTRRTFDVFVVNSFSSLMQMLATMILLPLTLFLAPVQGGGQQHIANCIQMLFHAKYMPWLTLLYISCNVIFNVCGLTLMKHASSTVALIASICALPLVSLVFCLPLPLLTPSPFSWTTCLGLVFVMFGVCVYNIYPVRREPSPIAGSEK